MQQINPGSIQWDSQPQPVQQNNDPIVAPAPPSERRAQVDQQLQIERANRQAAIEQENLNLRQQANERANIDQERQQSQFEGRGGGLTESQSKATNFYQRTASANVDYERLNLPPESLAGLFGKEVAPNVLASISSDDRNAARSAVENFIAATLRVESGAAIGDSEFERQYRIYFPSPNAGPEEIEQKRRQRQLAIRGFSASAGPDGLDLANSSLIELGYTDADGNLIITGQAPDSAVSQPPEGTQTPPTDGEQRQYGRDERGNPLIIVGPEGPQLLMRGQLSDGEPIYASAEKHDASSFNAAALDLSKEMGRVEELDGEAGFFDVAKSGITLGLSDEAAGVGAAIGGVLTGDLDVTGNFSQGQAIEQSRVDQGRENLGGAALPVELLGAGGALRGLGAFAQTRQAVGSLRNSGRAVNRASVQGRMARRATTEGAAIGGVSGAAQGDTLQERGTNALLGAGAGGVLGRVGQSVSNALANRQVNAATSTRPGAQIQQAADDLGIQPIPAVTGGTTTQRLTAGARQGFISDRPIAQNVARMERQGGAARARIADEVGQSLDAEDAGGLIRQAANVYSERTSQIGGRLYERASSRAGDARFSAPTALERADKWLGELGESAAGKQGVIYREIQSLRDKVADGEFSLMAIPRTRDELRATLQERGLRGTTLDTATKDILDGFEQDILSGLRSSGRGGAADAFETATEFWARRVETIDEVLEPLLGRNSPKSGERIVTALEGMAKPKTGDAATLRRLMQALPAREASSVRATLINRMGLPTPGAAQNADEAGFSFNTFMTNWNNMSPRAKTTVFPKESREALNRLATVSRGVKEAGSALNTSNTAGTIVSQSAISGAVFWAADPLAAIGAAGGQYAIGKLLANPGFARALAGVPRQATAAQRQTFNNRLGNLAAQEPAIAREIGIYQRALAANDNAGANLAASEEDPQPAN